MMDLMPLGSIPAFDPGSTGNLVVEDVKSEDVVPLPEDLHAGGSIAIGVDLEIELGHQGNQRGKWPGMGLNHRRGAFQAPALPTELPGLETNGQRRIRTADTGTFNPVLYQLSYLTQESEKPRDREVARL